MAVILWTVVPLAVLHAAFAVRRSWLPLLRFQLLVDLGLAVVVGPALVTGGALDPVRCLERNRPFSSWEFADGTWYQPTQSDVVLQFHPWWAEARRLMASGELPVVSDRIGGGMPLLAHGQIGLFAPVMAPVWFLGPERGTTVMAFWKIEAAALGCFLLLLVGWRLRPAGAAVGGLVWGLGACQVAWLLVPLGWVTAALPWAMWATTVAVRGRWGWPRVAGAGVALGWLMGAGLHPETAVVVTLACLGWATVLRPRRVGRLLVVAGIAALLATTLAWPNLRAIGASPKLERSRLGHEPLPAGVRAPALAQLLVPAAVGHPSDRGWSAPYPYAPAAMGVGGAALAAIAGAGIGRRRRRWLVAAVACGVAGLALAYRLPPLDAMLGAIPPIPWMTLPRFAPLVPFAAAVLAALAVDAADRRALRPLAVRLLPAAALAGVVAATSGLRPPGSPSTVLAAMTVAAAVLAAVVARRTALVGLVVALELSILAVGINPVAARSDWLPRPPLVVELQRLVDAEGGRVSGIGGVLPPNLASRYGIADLRAYDPVRPWPYAEMLAWLGQPEPILGGALSRAPSELLGAWSVRFLVAPPEARPEGWVRVFGDPSGAIWRNPEWLPEVRAVGRTVEADAARGWDLLTGSGVDLCAAVVVPPGTPDGDAAHAEVVAVDVSAARIRAATRCDGPCMLVVARPWSPGWRATVDGRRVAVVRANLAGLGVAVPAGDHEVELRYRAWAGLGE